MTKLMNYLVASPSATQKASGLPPFSFVFATCALKVEFKAGLLKQTGLFSCLLFSSFFSSCLFLSLVSLLFFFFFNFVLAVLLCGSVFPLFFSLLPLFLRFLMHHLGTTVTADERRGKVSLVQVERSITCEKIIAFVA